MTNAEKTYLHLHNEFEELTVKIFANKNRGGFEVMVTHRQKGAEAGALGERMSVSSFQSFQAMCDNLGRVVSGEFLPQCYFPE